MKLLASLAAVIVLTLFGVSVIAQTQTPEQTIAQLQALLASAREQRQAATDQLEQLGAIIRLEREAAQKAAKECAAPAKDKSEGKS